MKKINTPAGRAEITHLAMQHSKTQARYVIIVYYIHKKQLKEVNHYTNDSQLYNSYIDSERNALHLLRKRENIIRYAVINHINKSLTL